MSVMGVEVAAWEEMFHQGIGWETKTLRLENEQSVIVEQKLFGVKDENNYTQTGFSSVEDYAKGISPLT